MTLAVLLPNYNNGPYLKECLESVFSQTYQDFMVYFIDDCSTDNSVEVALSFPQDKMKIVRKTSNTGIVDTLNEGLRLIGNKYFVRMDGDDLCHPERFERLVRFMDDHAEIGACSSAIRTFGVSEEVWKYGTDPEYNNASLIFIHPIGHASSIFRTSVLKKNNIQYEDNFWRMEDYWLFYRLRHYTKITSIPDPLYLYRREHYNTNAEIEVKKNVEIRKFYEMILSELGLSNDAKAVSVHMQLAGREAPEFSYRTYKNQVRRILKANRDKKSFSVNALNLKLNDSLRSLICKLIDDRKLVFFDLPGIVLKFPSVVRYYLNRRFSKG